MSGDQETVKQCEILQDDEIEVLESIYPTLLAVQPNPSNRPGKLLNISIPIVLAGSITTILTTAASDPSSSNVLPSLQVSHLPGLSVKVLFPSTYPLKEPPRIASIKAQLPEHASKTSWMNRKQLGALQDRLKALWEEEVELSGEGAGVIWRWWEWIGNGDALRDLNMYRGEELHLQVPPAIPPSSFHTMLKTYNAGQIHSSFEATAFSCAICMESRKGKTCVQMEGCGCVFCTPCLSSCWSLAIEEGTLENVSCPSVTCVKTRATRENGSNEAHGVDREVVSLVVGEELRDRWEKLKDKRKAEIDPSYTICPRPTCQAAVPPPPLPSTADLQAQAAISSRAIRLADIANPSVAAATPPTPTEESRDTTTSAPIEDRWARYRLCPTCNYSFCLYCSATWHGPHTPCAFPQTSALVQEYLSYPEDSPQRRAMEFRKGKANIERMVAKWQEDEENRKWLESRTRPCAGCGVRVEKSHGCNHMTCGRCNAHFCYRCGDSISPQDPYAHFRRPGHACYNRLFDQEEIDRFERETAAGIAGIQLADDDGGEWREFRGIWE